MKRRIIVCLLLLFTLLGCQQKDGSSGNGTTEVSDTNPILDIDFVEANAEIGLTKSEVEDIFGDSYFSGEGETENSEVWVYDKVKNNFEYEKSIQIVQFDEIKKGNVEYQLYINFQGEESFMYLYFYRGEDGQFWRYEVTPDGKQKSQG
jgi:hypothetical protein